MNKKVTCTRVRPNPIFEEWLLKMYEDAKKSKSHLEDMLRESLESLMKYPLPLKSGAECIILKGFDRKLCMYLDKLLLEDISNGSNGFSKLIETGSDNSISKTSPVSSKKPKKDVGSTNNISDKNLRVDDMLPELSSKQDTECHDMLQHEEVDDVQASNTTPPASTGKGKGKGKGKHGEKKTEKYKPAHRSGGYAILVALLEHSLENPDKPALTKDELVEKAQKHAEESLLQPAINSYYSGWSNMSTLKKKGLVKSVRHKKVEFSLTEEGEKLAKEILEDAKNIPNMNDIILTSNYFLSSSPPVEQNDNNSLDDQFQIPSTSGNLDAKNVIEFPPGSFEVILLIDKNETSGLRKKNDPKVAQFNKYPDLKHEYRSLKVGDYAWIAKHEVHQEQEIVLPYIVERKRMDDLGASIKDGRFHEQKFRLRKCGIANIIYLIESYGTNTNVGLPIQNLMQAIANTRVHDGFQVQMTDSLTHSAQFLAMLTRRLTIRFKARHLRGCNGDPKGEMLMTFEYFNKASAKSKPLSVKETFIKMLLQLKGMSVDKALIITKKYPTPNSLIRAYSKCDRNEGETLLASLKYGDYHRKVGPATSKAIYQLFSKWC